MHTFRSRLIKVLHITVVASLLLASLPLSMRVVEAGAPSSYLPVRDEMTGPTQGRWVTGQRRNVHRSEVVSSLALPAARILSAPPANENDDWNLTGSWQWEAHITAGPDAGQTVNGTVQFDQEGTALGGYFTSSKGNGTLAGTYVNNHLSINYHIPPNYSAHVEASATHDGTRLAGSWADSSGNGGTYVAWGQVPPLPPREQFFGGDGCLGRIPSGESLDPVNTALGNYMHQDVDLQVPAPGLPFAFRRVYNSQDETVGTLGRGWTHSYNLYLVRDGKIVTVTMESGARHVYRQITDTVYYMRPFGVFADLVRGSVGYTLTRPAQVTYTFSLDGHLTGIFDAHGNRVGLGYDGDDLSVITGTVGRAYHLQYDGAGRLTALSDPIGRVVRYGYEGDLLTVITGTRGVTTTITYDAGGRLATLARASRPVVANGYDGEGRVIWQQQWGSSVYTVTYTTESSDGMTYTATTITDPLGRVTTDYHDDHFRHVRRVDALGSEAPTEFDAYYSPRVITDTNGHATRLGYDSNGNVIYAVGLSLPYTTSFTYDSRNDLTSATDAAGYTTLYEYDEQDNLVAQTDPLSGTVHYAYNGCGQVISTTNELGHTTLYGYDELGQRVAMTDTLGNVTAYSYDGVGRLVTTTNPAGQVTVNEYDDGDNLVRVTQNYLSGGYPQNWQNVYNLVTEYGYDALGNRVTVTGTLGHVTRYEYDAVGNLIKKTDKNGNGIQGTRVQIKAWDWSAVAITDGNGQYENGSRPVSSHRQERQAVRLPEHLSAPRIQLDHLHGSYHLFPEVFISLGAAGVKVVFFMQTYHAYPGCFGKSAAYRRGSSRMGSDDYRPSPPYPVEYRFDLGIEQFLWFDRRDN